MPATQAVAQKPPCSGHPPPPMNTLHHLPTPNGSCYQHFGSAPPLRPSPLTPPPPHTHTLTFSSAVFMCLRLRFSHPAAVRAAVRRVTSPSRAVICRTQRGGGHGGKNCSSSSSSRGWYCECLEASDQLYGKAELERFTNSYRG